MHCRFNEVTGDYEMFDSGALDARPIRLASHNEIALFYLQNEMYEKPQDFAGEEGLALAGVLRAAIEGEQ